MKQITFLKSFFLLCALIAGSVNVWADEATKKEGFETATASSTYNTTVNYTTDVSDCGVAWTMYFACVSTNSKIAGTKSAQIRHYKNDAKKYGYIQTTTPIYGLSKVSFKIKIGNIGDKIDVLYSENGTSWTKIGDTHTFSSTTQTTIEANVPSGGKYIKIGLSDTSSTPSSTSWNTVIDDVVFTYTTHALTYSATNGSVSVKNGTTPVASGSQIAEYTPLTVVASGEAGYAFDGWTVTGTGSSVASSSAASTTFTMGTTDATLAASFVQDATEYTVTCNAATNGSVGSDISSALSGATITLTTTPSLRYHTTGVTVTDAGSNEIPLTKIDANTYTFNMPASNVTVDATFDNTYTDILNCALTGVTGTNYTTWSGKTNNSPAVYAGNTAAGNSAIQMKKATSSENSGVYTTVSAGYARKITVTWNTNTSNGRTVEVWGKNTPISSPKDMRSGTSLGTIKYGTSTELNITDDYMYIGIEGPDGAVYCDEIDVKWEQATSTIVNINAACTDGEKYYGTFGFENAFVVPAGVTVSAVGVDGDGKLVVTDYSTGDVVKANTGVMVSSTTAGDKVLTLSASTGTEIDGNMLKASGAGLTAAEMAAAAPSCLYYRLTMHNGEKIGYWWGAAEGASFAIAANKAYLAVPTETAARMSGFTFDGTTTGIDALDNLTNSQIDNAPMYNLAGQRVNKSYKGVVIVNGKKMLNK